MIQFCEGTRCFDQLISRSSVLTALPVTMSNRPVYSSALECATRTFSRFNAATISATTLASNVTIPADTKVSVTNTDNAAGYPIASFTWALIYKEQNYNGRTKDQATKLVKLLWWNIHEGQKFCEALNYAPLSKSAVKAAEAVLKSATYGGKAIL